MCKSNGTRYNSNKKMTFFAYHNNILFRVCFLSRVLNVIIKCADNAVEINAIQKVLRVLHTNSALNQAKEKQNAKILSIQLNVVNQINK